MCWFLTALVHELVHYCDFLTTPFGADFYRRTLREYLAFQTLVPHLLRHPQLIPEGRLVDADPESMAMLPVEAQEAWNELCTQMWYFEAIGDGGAIRPRSDRIVEGWGEKQEPLSILGRKIKPVTVRDFYITIEIPDTSGWYLRPLAVLEARAVAHSLMWLSYLFHSTEHAQSDVLRYFRVFYTRQGQLADYTFLLNLAARLSGRDKFDSYIEDMNLGLIHRMCEIVASVGWYALRAHTKRRCG